MSKKSPKQEDIVVGQNVRRIRTLRGMSQTNLGEALGLTFQQVQKYEKGTNRMGSSTLVRTCAALKCGMDELFAGIGHGGKIEPDPFREFGNIRGASDLVLAVLMLPPKTENGKGKAHVVSREDAIQGMIAMVNVFIRD